MLATTILFSLVAAASASKALHYTVPTAFKAVANNNCTLPAEFVVTDFTTYQDKTKGAISTVHFTFLDPDTKIKTTCERNPSSKASGPSRNVYRCDNPYIGFVYQTTGIAGLTLTEVACPGTGPAGFEAAGLVQPKLICEESYTETVCSATPTKGVFDSLQPAPPALHPSIRGIRGSRRS
ncbi:hypothetical protein GGS20DRAFT_107921 [Poronia punctata]|nr:hypothetical protein GGS20DRAFT_107921 [Poronia punctata]